jgi:triosephosphate isomerase
MARRPCVAGNWKMNTTREEARGLVADITSWMRPKMEIVLDIGILPPFVYLDMIREMIEDDEHLILGAQDVYFEERGAFTGEISCEMLKDVGCTTVLCGHSERRHVLGETDALVNKKVNAALAAGLDVILAVGEKIGEREAGKTKAVCRKQTVAGLEGVSAEQMAKVVIAYEPVWAIGTGKVATAQQAQDAHAFLRGVLAKLYGAQVADATRIQYGGSVKPDNAAAIMAQPDVDGALVGGASLQADAFLGIIEATAKAKGL